MAPKRRRQDKAQSRDDSALQKRTKYQDQNDTSNAAATATETTSTSTEDSTSNLTQPTQSAAAQVFATTELLEQILLSVDDLKSLLCMRRVAPQWRTVIDETSSLKKKMWLTPQQPDHEWYLRAGAGETFLRRRPTATIAGGAAAAAAAAAVTADAGDIVYKSGRVNPLLFKSELAIPIWESHLHGGWVSQPLYLLKDPSSSFRKARSLHLQMFATQPPVPVVFLKIRAGRNELRSYRCLLEQVKNTKGVKVGDVLRAASHWSNAQDIEFVVEEMMFPLDGYWEDGIDSEPFRGFGYLE